MIKLVIILLAGLCVFFAYAEEPIPITYSETMDRVVFDGKWTFEQEWKQSSLDTYLYDNGNTMIILRSAHQSDFVYIFVDAVTDESLDINLDYAIVCFDSENNKNVVPASDDHCFMSTLGSNIGVMLQGDHVNSFKQIDNHPDLIAIGGTSDQNDRYSGVLHAGYEFRIPTDIIGRNSMYGFYFLVYDAHTKKYYTYPTDLSLDGHISTPDTWSEIYSPDKSLPEFHLSFFVLLISLSIIILISKRDNVLNMAM